MNHLFLLLFWRFALYLEHDPAFLALSATASVDTVNRSVAVSLMFGPFTLGLGFSFAGDEPGP